jgi:hypothetical protein
MQSTPSRAKHSTSILAPLINVDIFRSTSKIPVMLHETRRKTKKAIGWFRPADGLWNLGSGWPSGGAGYDDRNNNSDGRKVADWKTAEHRGTNR